MMLTRLSYKTRFAPYLTAVQQFLDQTLSPREPETLWAAMRHGVLNGGKRIRPVILIETCVAGGGSIEEALSTACALELIHCYSLIHDDLPCMDDDDLRRGLPTVHKAFSENMAVLAGDALNAMAFGLIADDTYIPAECRIQLISALSKAASVEGLVNGQVDDLQFMNTSPSEENLRRIHKGKTGALFRYTTWAGGVLSNQPPEILDLLATFGETLGIAFQIADDLLDIQSTDSVLGKTTGKDVAQGKLTFPAVYGEVESQKLLAETVGSLQLILTSLAPHLMTENLAYLVEFVQQRDA